LIINIDKYEDEDNTQASTSKREKQPKEAAKAEAVKGIEEDQPKLA
jgi:hypothetical protein